MQCPAGGSNLQPNFQRKSMGLISYATSNSLDQPTHLCSLVKAFLVYIKYRTFKGTTTLIISVFDQKELDEPRILIQVSSKSVEKWVRYGHLKNSRWPTFI